MNFHIRETDIHLLELRTRMPFKYGIATMTSTPHAIVRVHVDIDGQRAVGCAADHLPPKWFTKDPERAIDGEVAEMLSVVGQACMQARGLRAATVFEAWQQLYWVQSDWGRAARFPPLLTHLGTSLVERAMIDAFCRHRGQPFARLLAANAFGIRLGDVHTALAQASPSDFLPPSPIENMILRHTIGLADPLADEAIPEAERCNDGLPQSLAACIKAYGLRQLKIKVSGQLAPDRDRLTRIAAVLAALAPPDYLFSLDGNEQFHSFEAFRTFWNELTSTPQLKSFFKHLRFIEQPLHRSVALSPEAGNMKAGWPRSLQTIIDESDGDLDSMQRALELGYAGTSHKNCKGVFKGIANRCLLAHLERQHPDRQYLMTGEDLANIGPIALLQDLAVCAALGLDGVERNGHHYFAGLSMFPRAIQHQVLEHHGDLYRASPAGWPALAIRDGLLSLETVNAAPFGVAPLIDLEPLPCWKPNS